MTECYRLYVSITRYQEQQIYYLHIDMESLQYCLVHTATNQNIKNCVHLAVLIQFLTSVLAHVSSPLYDRREELGVVSCGPGFMTGCNPSPASWVVPPHLMTTFMGNC